MHSIKICPSKLCVSGLHILIPQKNKKKTVLINNAITSLTTTECVFGFGRRAMGAKSANIYSFYRTSCCWRVIAFIEAYFWFDIRPYSYFVVFFGCRLVYSAILLNTIMMHIHSKWAIAFNTKKGFLRLVRCGSEKDQRRITLKSCLVAFFLVYFGAILGLVIASGDRSINMVSIVARRRCDENGSRTNKWSKELNLNVFFTVGAKRPDGKSCRIRWNV